MQLIFIECLLLLLWYQHWPSLSLSQGSLTCARTRSPSILSVNILGFIILEDPGCLWEHFSISSAQFLCFFWAHLLQLRICRLLLMSNTWGYVTRKIFSYWNIWSVSTEEDIKSFQISPQTTSHIPPCPLWLCIVLLVLQVPIKNSTILLRFWHENNVHIIQSGSGLCLIISPFRPARITLEP